MRKINYKEPSALLEKIAAPNLYPSSRSSIGMEKFVGEYFFLDVNKLAPFKNQARRSFSEEEIDELAATIQAHGIRQPLTVLKVNDGRFEVVSGERRLRAAKSIGLNKVPCIIIDDAEKAEEIALIENIQRTDLHPVELSRSLKSLADKYGYGGQSEMANRLGLSKSKISELIKISDLPESVQEFILTHKVRGRELYRKLFRLKTEESKLSYLQAIASPSVKPGGEKLRNTSASVLRISLSENEFKIQKKYLSKLNQDQKLLLKNKLEELLEELS